MMKAYCLYFLCQSPESREVNDDYIRYGYMSIGLPKDYMQKYTKVEDVLDVLGYIFKLAHQQANDEQIVFLTELGFLKGTINVIKSNKHQYVKQIAERTCFTPEMVIKYLSRLVLRGRIKERIG
jgi:hypothetical protein